MKIETENGVEEFDIHEVTARARALRAQAARDLFHAIAQKIKSAFGAATGLAHS
ncbi:MAG: RSP_7527 family protein [Halocynthiibacter sp.]